MIRPLPIIAFLVSVFAALILACSGSQGDPACGVSPACIVPSPSPAGTPSPTPTPTASPTIAPGAACVRVGSQIADRLLERIHPTIQNGVGVDGLCIPIVPMMKTNWGKNGSTGVPDAVMNRFFWIVIEGSSIGGQDPAAQEMGWGHCWATQQSHSNIGCTGVAYNNMSLSLDFKTAGCTESDHPRADEYQAIVGGAHLAEATPPSNDHFYHGPISVGSPIPVSPSAANRDGVGNQSSSCTLSTTAPSSPGLLLATETLSGTAHAGDVVHTTITGTAVNYTLSSGDVAAPSPQATIASEISTAINAASIAHISATVSGAKVTIVTNATPFPFWLTATVTGSGATEKVTGTGNTDLIQNKENSIMMLAFSKQYEQGSLTSFGYFDAASGLTGGTLLQPFPWKTPKPCDITLGCGASPRPDNPSSPGTKCDGRSILVEDCYRTIYFDQSTCGYGRGTGGGLTPPAGPLGSLESDPSQVFDIYTGCFSGVAVDTLNFFHSRTHADGSLFLVQYNGLEPALDDAPVTSTPDLTNPLNGHGITCAMDQAGSIGDNIVGGGLEGAFLHFSQSGNNRGFVTSTFPQAINCGSDLRAIQKVAFFENYDRLTTGMHHDWRVAIEAATLINYDPDYASFGLALYDSSGTQDSAHDQSVGSADVHPEQLLVPIGCPYTGCEPAFAHGTTVGNGSGCSAPTPGPTPNAQGTTGGANWFVVHCGLDKAGFPGGVYCVEYQHVSFNGTDIGGVAACVNTENQNVSMATIMATGKIHGVYTNQLDCGDLISTSSYPKCPNTEYSVSSPPPTPMATDSSFGDGVDAVVLAQTGISIQSDVIDLDPSPQPQTLIHNGGGGSICGPATNAHPYGNPPSGCPTIDPNWVLHARGDAIILLGGSSYAMVPQQGVRVATAGQWATP